MAELPSLVVHVSTISPAIVVGDTATFTVTILNQATVPAEDMQIQVSIPDQFHVTATNPDIPQAGNKSPLQWIQQQLDPGAQAVYSFTGHLVQEPASGALLLEAIVQARGLDLPVSNTGGALVTARAAQRGPDHFVPGVSGHVQSDDGRISVDLPSQASDRALSLRAERLEDAKDRLKQRGVPIPAPVVFDYPAINTFVLSAEDDAGQDVHAFTSPVTLTIRYTPEQLRVLGIAEADLELFWFDDSQVVTKDDGTTQQGGWVPVPSQTDTQNHAVIAQLDHFSAYTLADGSSPSKAYMPSVQGWQVSTFTGAASYSYPIEVPAAAAGMKPTIELSYSSAATDGATGLRPKQQASWVGKGWSLDMGSIQLHRVTYTSYGAHYDYYTMALNGQSYELVRGEALVGQPNAERPDHWAWHPTDDNFMRIRVFQSGSSSSGNPGRGGFMDGVAQPRYTWQIWTKDGTRYDFAEDVWWGWVNSVQQQAEIQTNRWMLSKVVDLHGNTMQYNYARQSFIGGLEGDIKKVQGTVDQDIWLTEILWGMNPSQGETTARYKVSFDSVARENDTAFDTNPSNLYTGAMNGMTRETRKLTDIKVWSNAAGSWELTRQYHLNYDYSLHADEWPCQCSGSTQTFKLTLKSIEQRDKNGQIPNPSTGFVTSFAYNTALGSGAYSAGGWNRLQTVNNGQGGIITYVYDNIQTVPEVNLSGWFQNRHRVTQVTLSDGRGNVYPWNYSYGTPNVNAIGSLVNTYLKNNSDLSLGWDGMSQFPNSAPVYYVGMYDTDQARRVEREQKLTARPMTEFRGHNWVRVIDPTGAETEHIFYQGEAPCGYPKYQNGTPWGGNTILDQPCFHELTEYDMLKGREKKTVVRSSTGGPILQETEHRFGVVRYDWGPDPLSGLYRSFRYPRADITRQFEGGGTVLSLTRWYCYDPSKQGSAQHGNRTHTLEYFGEPAFINRPADTDNCDYPQTVSQTLPYRVNRVAYATKEDTTAQIYMADRIDQQVAFDGASIDAAGKLNSILSLKESFFDGSTTLGAIPGRGDLTLERSYRNLSESPMRSMDTSYGYDAWGNRTTTTTYTDWGTRSYPSYSAPGNGSTARTTTVAYDPIFHAFSVSSTNPLGHVERADYDYRMGTLIKVGGPNVLDDATFATFSCANANVNMEISCATYDSYGRMASLVRPGDTLSSPTLTMAYADSLIPFRYSVSRKVSSASGDSSQETVQFYDGMGRKIQEKREVDGGNTRMIVSDMSYDGLDRSIAASQPRYDTGTWDAYIAPTGGLFRPTTTTYDALGRTLRVTKPDNSYSELSYSLGSLGTITTAIDARLHKTTQESDLLGRLRQVVEYSGNGGSEGAYSSYATTTYSYDRLDRLVQVNDMVGNVTSLGYDALGRKTSMNDPDMGAWSYSYYPNGTLYTQTDARNIVTTLSYDALDRLTLKTYSSGSGNRSYNYDEFGGAIGKGRRTSICAFTGSSCTINQSWMYDGRGRQTSTTQTVNGSALTMVMSYDSADRMLTQTYPGGEVVTTSYDVAGRALSLCSSLGGCYVDNSGNVNSYTALDQPATRKLGNGLTTTWLYNTPLAQLERITTPGVFDRKYSYDPVANVSAIRNFTDNQTINYTYDHRDRLTRAWTVVGTAQAPVGPRQQALQPTAPGVARSPDAMEHLQAALVVDQARALDGPETLKVPGAYARLPWHQASAPQTQFAPTALIQDSFSRTVTNGWGTADTGGSYTAPSSNASNYSVSSGKGQLTIPTSNTSREQLLTGTGSSVVRDAELSVRMATDKLPTGTGGEVRFSTLLRAVDANNQYRMRLGILSDGSVKLQAEKEVAGAASAIGTAVTVSGLTATPNSFIRLRVQISGANPTSIQARAWADGSSEPSSWQLIVPADSEAVLQTAGAIGLRGFLTSSVTNAPIIASFDDLLVTTTTLAADSFTRTVNNGWGVADVGGSYATPSTNASNYAVNGSGGQLTITAANTNRELALTGGGNQTARDVDITARMTANKLPVGSGAEVRFAVLGRQVSVGNNYRGVVRLLADGSVKLQVQKLVGGSESWLGTGTTVPGLTVAANSFIRVRMQVSGANPTTLQMRAWADGSSEPTSWLVTQSDTSAALQTAGAVGLRTHLTSEVTNIPITASWDDWLVTVISSGGGSTPTPTPTSPPATNTPTPTSPPATNTPTPTSPPATNTPTPTPITAPSYDDSFGYDLIGNLMNKDGVIQQYGSNGLGQGAHPHAVTSVAMQPYSYDANGNLLSGGGRTLTWTAENQPSQIVSGTSTESYTYDADGARVTRSVSLNGGPLLTTRYVFGGYEVEGIITRIYYSLGGQPIAVRDSLVGVSYLYGDHIGSISASTNASGGSLSRQYYDAWGTRLSGNVSATRRSFTGQYLDDTGLLFYNARYYDPGIGRFVSADSIVPSAGSLTVTPNDAVATKAWGEKGAAGNPQELNRYSYVNNNPVGAGDPTGHCLLVCALVGGAIGAGVAYGVQVYQNTQSGMDIQHAMTTNINGAAIITGAAAGAVIGGTMGMASAGAVTGYTVGNALQMGAIGSVTNMAGNVVGQLAGGGSIKATDVAVAGVVGFAAGAVAPFVGDKLVASVAPKALGAAANIAQYVATQSIKGEKITGTGIVTNGVSGIVGGWIGGPITPTGLAFGSRGLARNFRAVNIGRVSFGRAALGAGISNQNYEP